MFNLLVSYDENSWNKNPYKLPFDRYLEHTIKEIRDSYLKLDNKTIEKLKSFPTIFVIEKESIDSRIGYITDVKVLSSDIKIYFEFDDKLPKLPSGAIENMKHDLDIVNNEIIRTHWAIKDENLFKILIDNKYLTEDQLKNSKFSTQKISSITRLAIMDELALENISWSGDLDEVDFLKRLYDLNNIPSSDHRYNDAAKDIFQHRINNYDWNDDWILNDSRFKLDEDEIFLKFLCESIHPIVRKKQDEVIKIYTIFNNHLTKDDFEIVEKEKISGRPVFIGQKKYTGKFVIQKSSKEITNHLSDNYVKNQIDLMNAAIDKDIPLEAIGKAKELIETICHTILEEGTIEINANWDLIKLFKQTTKQLNLTPDEIDESAKASETIKNILRSLATMVQGLGELRNQYGSGHGKKSKFKGLTSRHAKLAVGAATTLAIFLLETHKIRK
jgi:hypothetical protein